MFKGDSGKEPQAARLVGLLMTIFALSLVPNLIVTVVHGSGIGPQRGVRRTGQNTTKPRAREKPRIDYSRFSHITHVTTQKLSSDSCHKFPTKNWKDVRKGDTAFTDVTEFPE